MPLFYELPSPVLWTSSSLLLSPLRNPYAHLLMPALESTFLEKWEAEDSYKGTPPSFSTFSAFSTFSTSPTNILNGTHMKIQSVTSGEYHVTGLENQPLFKITPVLPDNTIITNGDGKTVCELIFKGGLASVCHAENKKAAIALLPHLILSEEPDQARIYVYRGTRFDKKPYHWIEITEGKDYVVSTITPGGGSCGMTKHPQLIKEDGQAQRAIGRINPKEMVLDNDIFETEFLYVFVVSAVLLLSQ